jgi:ribosomal protein S8E
MTQAFYAHMNNKKIKIKRKKKTHHKKGLVEWLKVKALSASPSTAKQNKTKVLTHGTVLKTLC